MSTVDIGKIKRAARLARRASGTPITAYLNGEARKNGFHTWDNFLRAQEGIGSPPVLNPLAGAPVPTDMNPHRKLMVLALNELLARGLVSLSGRDEDHGHLITELAGESSVVIWHGISGDELTLAVWWKYDHTRHPQANLEGNYREEFLTTEPLAKQQHYPKFVGVTVSGWLERKTGKYLQGSGRDHLMTYTRRGERKVLETLPNPVPLGYSTEGRFFR